MAYYGDGSTLTGTQDEGARDDVALLGFKVAANGSLVKYNLVDQTIDNWQDLSGIDAGASTNETLSGAGGYIYGAATSTGNATGGTITTYTAAPNDYKVHTFTSDGNFIVPGTGNVDALIVAGGGAGGGAASANCGGGGAGGAITQSPLACTAQTYAMVIGDGGAPGGSNAMGVDGDDSTGFGMTAMGGGYGGGPGNSNGNAGGCGGGGATSSPGGASTQTSNGGGTGVGNAGGTGGGGTTGRGGGGGTLAAGATGAGRVGGTGGAPVTNDWQTGATLYYGGGGGGSQISAPPSYGGPGQGGGTAGSPGDAVRGGGGNGNNYNWNDAADGTDGLGGGGGSQETDGGVTPSGQPGGDGGNGVAIIRYIEDGFTTVTSGGDLTLVSIATVAEAVPTKADIVMTYSNGEGTATLNTDLKAWMSRDDGSTYTQCTLADQGDTGGHTIVTAHNVDISGQPSGTNMRYKITTHNQSAGSKETFIQAMSSGWS